jgi:hypothetical protein
MNIKRYQILGSMLFAFAFLSGCKDMIETKPTEQIEADQALNSKGNIESATYGAYAILRHVNLYGRDLLVFGDALADNTLHTNVSTSLFSVYNNATAAHFDNWIPGYYGINRINLALEAIDKINADEQWKDGLRYQLLFLRALIYFDLAKVYGYDKTAIHGAGDRGTVPLITKGVKNVSDIQISPRASIDETYAFIFKDLDDATTAFRRAGEVSTSQHRVTMSAINALYARVALHGREYRTAINKASEVINGTVGRLTSVSDYLSGWRAETHPESIFEIKVNVNENIGANNSLRATYTSRAFLTSTEPATHGIFAVSDELFSLYAATDVRKSLIMKGLGNNINRNEMTKFISKNGVKDLDNIPVFRMPEMYLIKAEAYQNTNIIDSAQHNLNVILNSRGLAAVTITGNALKDEILKQRRLEFAFEGHRWFDLKRTGGSINKPNLTSEINSTSFKILANIPVSEVNSSGGVVRQNRGY